MAAVDFVTPEGCVVRIPDASRPHIASSSQPTIGAIRTIL